MASAQTLRFYQSELAGEVLDFAPRQPSKPRESDGTVSDSQNDIENKLLKRSKAASKDDDASGDPKGFRRQLNIGDYF